MKHTVKKLFATFLSIAMIFSICLMPAYAADNDGQKTRAISPQNGAVLATLAYSDENTEVYYIQYLILFLGVFTIWRLA